MQVGLPGIWRSTLLSQGILGAAGIEPLRPAGRKVQSSSTPRRGKSPLWGHFGLWMQGVGGLDPAGCLSFAATEMLAHQAVSSPPTATRPVARKDGQLSLSLRDKAAAAGYRPRSVWQSGGCVQKKDFAPRSYRSSG